jgi:hypothetical protein
VKLPRRADRKTGGAAGTAVSDPDNFGFPQVGNRLRLASQEHTPRLVPTISARNYADVAVTIKRWRYESFWEEIATPKVRRRAAHSNFATINWMAMIFFAAFLRIPVVCFRR